MTTQDNIKLNKAKCLLLNQLICEIQGYWAAYAAKKSVSPSVALPAQLVYFFVSSYQNSNNADDLISLYSFMLIRIQQTI